MNTKQKIFLVIVVIIGIIFLASSSYTIQNNSSCFLSGGTWKMFSSACVDSCTWERDRELTICASVISYGCDCGPLRCWNHDTRGCEFN